MNDPDMIVMDFFSGSATTADAIMQMNAKDGGNRKYICIQYPEECDKKSVAYKDGYLTISEIGKERIRRAGAKIKEENPIGTQDLDTGFRVLKLADSNMNDVYYSVDTVRICFRCSNRMLKRIVLTSICCLVAYWNGDFHSPCHIRLK